MPGPEIRALAEDVRTLAFGGIGANYADIGGVTENPIRVVMVKNATDTTIEVSWDGGATTVFRLPPGSHDTLDMTANQKGGGGLFLPVGVQFQVRHTGVAPTSGEAIIQCFYG